MWKESNAWNAGIGTENDFFHAPGAAAQAACERDQVVGGGFNESDLSVFSKTQ